MTEESKKVYIRNRSAMAGEEEKFESHFDWMVMAANNAALTKPESI
jgi:hypothetical protein